MLEEPRTGLSAISGKLEGLQLQGQDTGSAISLEQRLQDTQQALQTAVAETASARQQAEELQVQLAAAQQKLAEAASEPEAAKQASSHASPKRRLKRVETRHKEAQTWTCTINGFRVTGEYQGSWSGGVPHGPGFFTGKAGRHVLDFKGFWEHGDCQGFGQLTGHEEGKPEEVRQYIGLFHQGMLNGHGIETWPSGEKYAGEIAAGKRCGQGIYTFANGQRYAGEWADNCRQGWGVLTCPDGSKYDGEWARGEEHGRGVCTDASGKHEDTVWVHGVKQ